MIIANKADTCVSLACVCVLVHLNALMHMCKCVGVHNVIGKVQALGALPARLASKQCLFNNSCEGENAVCLCSVRARARVHGIRCTHMHILNKEEEGSD